MIRSDLSSRTVASAALIAGVFGIAWAPILFRFSDVGPISSAFWRVMLAVPMLWTLRRFLTDALVTRNEGARPPQPSDSGFIGLVAAGLFFAGDLVFWHLSLMWTSVANATLLANAAPVFVALGAWVFLRRRFSTLFLAGLVLAILGAALLMRGSLRISVEHLRGDVLGIVAAVFLAGYLLTVERLRNRHDTLTLMLWGAMAGAGALLPLALLSGERFLPTEPSGWLVLLALAGVCQTAGQGLIAYSMAQLPAPFTAIVLLLQPMLAAVFAWAVLDERLGLEQGIGGAVILAGIALARFGGGAAGPQPVSQRT